MINRAKTSAALVGLIALFLLLAASFVLRVWARPAPVTRIPLVDSSFTSNATVRVSYSQLVALKAALSDFDCYACHERNNPPPLRFDAQHILLVPKEHADIVMGHGSHNRNNLC